MRLQDPRRRRRITFHQEHSNSVGTRTRIQSSGKSRQNPSDANNDSEITTLSPFDDFIPANRVRCWLTIALLAVPSITALLLGFIQATHPQQLPAGLAPLLNFSTGTIWPVMSGLSLLITSQLAWIIYWYRRHSPRDFEGHYKIWIWTSITWGFLGVVALTRFHTIVSEAFLATAQVDLSAFRTFIWLAPVAALVLELLYGLDRELSASRGSWSLLCVSAIGALLYIPQVSGWQPTTDLALNSLLLQVTGVVTTFSLLLSHFYFARYVIHVSANPRLEGRGFVAGLLVKIQTTAQAIARAVHRKTFKQLSSSLSRRVQKSSAERQQKRLARKEAAAKRKQEAKEARELARLERAEAKAAAHAEAEQQKHAAMNESQKRKVEEKKRKQEERELAALERAEAKEQARKEREAAKERARIEKIKAKEQAERDKQEARERIEKEKELERKEREERREAEQLRKDQEREAEQSRRVEKREADRLRKEQERAAATQRQAEEKAAAEQREAEAEAAKQAEQQRKQKERQQETKQTPQEPEIVSRRRKSSKKPRIKLTSAEMAHDSSAEKPVEKAINSEPAPSSREDAIAKTLGIKSGPQGRQAKQFRVDPPERLDAEQLKGLSKRERRKLRKQFREQQRAGQSGEDYENE